MANQPAMIKQADVKRIVKGAIDAGVDLFEGDRFDDGVRAVFNIDLDSLQKRIVVDTFDTLRFSNRAIETFGGPIRPVPPASTEAMSATSEATELGIFLLSAHGVT